MFVTMGPLHGDMHHHINCNNNRNNCHHDNMNQSKSPDKFHPKRSNDEFVLKPRPSMRPQRDTGNAASKGEEVRQTPAVSVALSNSSIIFANPLVLSSSAAKIWAQWQMYGRPFRLVTLFQLVFRVFRGEGSLFVVSAHREIQQTPNCRVPAELLVFQTGTPHTPTGSTQNLLGAWPLSTCMSCRITSNLCQPLPNKH